MPHAPTAGFILAGGESSRMGSDKALLILDRMPLLLRMVRLLESVATPVTVVGHPGDYDFLGLRIVDDDWPGAGPLGGIATALGAAKTPWTLIVACDLPYLTREWLDYLIDRALASEADALLPLNTCGLEPLCAMYHKRCIPAISGALTSGMRKVTDAITALRLETIAPTEWKTFDPEGWLFKNMNSSAEYEEAKARLDTAVRPEVNE